MLVLPPQWVPERPYLSLPALTAYLRREGIRVIQKDFNIEAYEVLLSKNYLKGLSKTLDRRFELIDAKAQLSPGLEQRYYNDLFMAKSFCGEIASKVENAKNFLRNPKILDDLAALEETRETLNKALAIVSMAYFPTTLDLSSFRMPVFSGSVSSLKEVTQNEDMNPFLGLFKTRFIPSILEEKPDIVGITIAGQSQQIPALTLARLVKSIPGGPHVVVGGHVVTLLNDVLPTRTELFDTFFDSAIRFDGERPLFELAKSLDRGSGLESVPNLIFRDSKGIHVNPISPPEDFDSLPPPDFDGLPLDKYLSPLRVLPIQSSRGCYWDKCAFCTHSRGYGKKYQPRNPSKVIADINHLKAKYNCSHFAFEDEVISPRAANLLSNELINTHSEVTLTSNIRLEKQFTPELCQKMAKAGFKVLYLGFESASQRVLDLMDKGITPSVAEEVCRNVHDAGIWTHLYVMFGFPGEESQDARETIDFLRSHKAVINSFHTENFVLSKGSNVSACPEKWDIEIDTYLPEGDFNGNLQFIHHSGLSQSQALDLSVSTMNDLAIEFEGDRLLNALGHFYLPVYLSTKKGPVDFVQTIQPPNLLDKDLTVLTGSSTPKLKQGVTLERLNFNLVNIRQNVLEKNVSCAAYPERVNFIFAHGNGGFRKVSIQAAEILAYCNGYKTITKIAIELGKKYDAPVAQIQADCMSVLKSFYDDGFLAT